MGKKKKIVIRVKGQIVGCSMEKQAKLVGKELIYIQIN
jgi:hypothetical protein